jgi:hypothetical protein
MKPTLKFCTLILIVSTWPVTAEQLQAAQVHKQQVVDIRLDQDIHLKDWRVLDIFLYLMRSTGLHGGFVEIARCSDLPKGNLDLKQGSSLQQAMDALVAANLSYHSDLRDGVVDLTPRGGAPLLRTKVSRFKMSATDKEKLLAIGDVLALPEVQRRAAALGLKEGPSQVGLFGGESHPVEKKATPLEIDVQNLMLQDVLNSIAKATPKGIWYYHESDCDKAKTYFVQLTSEY